MRTYQRELIEGRGEYSNYRPTNLPVLEDVVVDLVVNVSDDERVRGRARAGKEGVVMGCVGHLTDPVRVELGDILHAHHFGVNTETLQGKNIESVAIIIMLQWRIPALPPSKP